MKNLLRILLASSLAILTTSATTNNETKQQETQVQGCGGTVYFCNKSGREVYLYGQNVSKYNPSNFTMCDCYRATIPSGNTVSIFVPEGQSFNFAVYDKGCYGNNIVASGIYQDCQAVGQTHYIYF